MMLWSSDLHVRRRRSATLPPCSSSVEDHLEVAVQFGDELLEGGAAGAAPEVGRGVHIGQDRLVFGLQRRGLILQCRAVLWTSSKW